MARSESRFSAAEGLEVSIACGDPGQPIRSGKKPAGIWSGPNSTGVAHSASEFCFFIGRLEQLFFLLRQLSHRCGKAGQQIGERPSVVAAEGLRLVVPVDFQCQTRRIEVQDRGHAGGEVFANLVQNVAPAVVLRANLDHEIGHDFEPVLRHRPRRNLAKL